MSQNLSEETTLEDNASDLSESARTLGREIDRLPPGEYVIHLTKPDIKGVPITGEIRRTDRIRLLNLFR